MTTLRNLTSTVRFAIREAGYANNVAENDGAVDVEGGVALMPVEGEIVVTNGLHTQRTHSVAVAAELAVALLDGADLSLPQFDAGVLEYGERQRCLAAA